MDWLEDQQESREEKRKQDEHELRTKEFQIESFFEPCELERQEKRRKVALEG